MAVQYAGSALLPPPLPKDAGKICLVLDLDETLVHSSFRVRRTRVHREFHHQQPVPDADFIVPIEIEGQTHQARACCC